jgi:hypothetical protein
MAGYTNANGVWVEDYTNDGTYGARGPNLQYSMTGGNMATNTSFPWSDLIGPALGAGASIYGANQVRNSADAATGIQQGATNQALGNLAPAQALTSYALPRLTGPMNLHNLPGYDASIEQGEQGINRGMAARGMFNSGAALKGLTKFNNETAQNAYGNEWNRLNSLLQTGMGATNNANALIAGQGNAGAAGQIAKGNATNTGLLGAGVSLADYLTAVPRGSSTSNGSSLASGIGGLLGSGYRSLSDYFSGDGSANGGYTGTGNTIDSLIGNGGYSGSGGGDYWSNYTPSQDYGTNYSDYMAVLDQ